MFPLLQLLSSPPLSPPPPHLDATAAHSFTCLGHVVGAQSFFGHGFFDAGAPQRGSMNYSGTAYSEEWAREAAVHGHGTWSMVFTSHQELGSLISGRCWRCPTVVCSWSPVTLGPAFELVTLRGGFGRRRGSLSLNWSWSHWSWSVRMVHGVAASEHAAVCNQLWQGAHTLLGEHFEWTGFISASKTASEGALGLVHHRGRCRGQVDWGQQQGVFEGQRRGPHTRGNLHTARL